MALKKRVISLVLVVSMVFMSVSVCTKKAEASPLVVGAAAVVAVVAFLGACGITFTLFNTDSDTFVDTVSSKMDEYAVAQGFADVAEWVAGCELARMGNSFLLNKLAVQKFAAFATWFKDNIGLSGGNTVVISSSGSSFGIDSDGNYYFGSMPVTDIGSYALSTYLGHNQPSISYILSSSMSEGTYIPFADYPDFNCVFDGTNFLWNFLDGTSEVLDVNMYSRCGVNLIYQSGVSSHEFGIYLYTAYPNSYFSMRRGLKNCCADLYTSFSGAITSYLGGTSVPVSDVSASAASTISIPDASTMALHRIICILRI